MKFALVIAALLLCSCTAFVKQPEVSLKDVKVVGLGADGVDVDFHLLVKNPNSFDLKMTGYTYDVRFMALPVVKGSSAETFTFYSNTSSDVLIPVKFGYREMLEILKRRPDPDAIPYQLHADIAMDTRIGGMNIPVNHTGTVSIPKEYRPSNILEKLGNFLKTRE
jgi:LEA14-like dessication related protein